MQVSRIATQNQLDIAELRAVLIGTHRPYRVVPSKPKWGYDPDYEVRFYLFVVGGRIVHLLAEGSGDELCRIVLLLPDKPGQAATTAWTLACGLQRSYPVSNLAEVVWPPEHAPDDLLQELELE